MGKYEKILHMERPADFEHIPMAMHNRAAQFAPFDALTGFGGRVHEASRTTQERIELTDEEKQTINEKILCLMDRLPEHPMISVTYFVPDRTKSGGSYETVTGKLKKVDTLEECLVLEGRLKIGMGEIVGICKE